MYTIKITNLITGYEFPVENIEKPLEEIKESISFSAKYLRLNVIDWDLDNEGGMYAILESDDKELKYRYEVKKL